MKNLFQMKLGTLSAVEQAIESARVGGCVLLAGSVYPVGQLKLEPERIVRRMLTIRGLHNYRTEDLKEAVDFLSRGCEAYPFGQLIDKVFPLSEVNQAFQYATRPDCVRVAIEPD